MEIPESAPAVLQSNRRPLDAWEEPAIDILSGLFGGEFRDNIMAIRRLRKTFDEGLVMDALQNLKEFIGKHPDAYSAFRGGENRRSLIPALINWTRKLEKFRGLKPKPPAPRKSRKGKAKAKNATQPVARPPVIQNELPDF